MLFGRSGSYNYSAIHSIKIPEVSQRTFKTKGLISTEGTFLGHPVQGVPKKSIPFQIQISHYLLKYRISLSYLVPQVQNLVSLRRYNNRLWLI